MLDMGYDQFKEILKTRMQRELGDKAELCYVQTAKNNTKTEVLAIQTKGEDTTLTIRLDGLYKSYEDTQSMEEGVNWILSGYSQRKEIPVEDFSFHWEQIKQKVRIHLVRLEGNGEYLRGKVYRQVMDLAMIFAAVLQESEETNAYAYISWEQMKVWGINSEILYHTAMKNLNEEEFIITDMDSIISSMLEQSNFSGGIPGESMMKAKGPDAPGLYVLTSKNRKYGARAMLRKDLLGKFAREQESSLFILPSSVDEVLLVREEDGKAEILKQIVHDINNDPNIIRAEDVLSYSVYHYDWKTGETSIAGEGGLHG